MTESGDAEVVGRTASKFLQSIKKVRVARCLALVLEVARKSEEIVSLTSLTLGHGLMR